MGIFGDDKLQDARLDALEEHIRILTETVQNNQTDLAACGIAILALQAQVDEKVSSSDVDPTIVELNEKLAKARVKLERISATAAEDWAEVQKEARSAFESLRASVNSAKDKIAG